MMTEEDLESLKEKLNASTDEDITTMLVYRNQFQPKAVDLAVNEAIRRGIISSIKDLDEERFAPQELPKQGFFPVNSDEKKNEVLLNSLCRIFYIAGIAPMLYAYRLFTASNYVVAVAALVVGAVIIFLSYKTSKRQKMVYSVLLAVVNISIWIGALLYRIIGSTYLSTIDIIAFAAVILVMLYTSLFTCRLSKLLCHKA